MNTQLLAKNPLTGSFVQLDLFDTDPIKLSIKVQDINKPMFTPSSFSRTFKVPNTNVNAAFFRAAFSVNSNDFDITKKAEAYIMDNGIFLIDGTIKLSAINFNVKDNSVEYSVNFFGNTQDFGSKVGGGFLNELNVSQYNHNKTYENIVNSWNLNLFGGDILYGLIEWGYKYDKNSRPIENTMSNAFDNSFTRNTNPLWLEQFKPQFRAKALWDVIFAEAGYTYSSDFLNSDFFKNIYIISEATSQSMLDPSNNFSAKGDKILTVTAGSGEILWDAKIEDYDPGNNYNNTTSKYTAPASGYYVFNITCKARQGNHPYEPTIEGFFSIMRENTNSVVASQTFTLDSGYGETFDLDFSCNLNEGDIIYATVEVKDLDGVEEADTKFYSRTFSCTTSPSVYDASMTLPTNVKKIDLIKSLIQRFKLILVPSLDRLNHFTIEPWNNWVREGSKKDWTSKLDGSKDIKIEPLFTNHNRLYVFKDIEDTDYLNDTFQKVNKETFGQLNLDSNIEVITGSTTISGEFAPLPLDTIGYKAGVGDVDAPKFLIPHIAKDTGATEDLYNNVASITGKREPIQPKMRLAFYNGLIPAPITWYLNNGPLGTGSAIDQTAYPLLSSYSTWPVQSTTFDLNWESDHPMYDTLEAGVETWVTPTATCFTSFWKTWYDTVFDTQSRLVTAYFILNFNDLKDFKFNDYVYVRDAWFLVNSISDYVVGTTSSCKVELLRVGNTLDLPIEPASNLYKLSLCYSPNTACDAYCCNNPGQQANFYYTDGATLILSSSVWLDPAGETFAPAGYYSDGTVIYQQDEAGIIIAAHDPSGCDCLESLTAFNTKYAIRGCDACNAGASVTLYGVKEEFYENVRFYANSNGTLFPAAGYYRLSTETSLAVQLNDQGWVINVFLCSDCFTPLYQYTAVQETTACLACCNIKTIQVWTDSATFATSTKIYLDNSGTEPAPIGYYAVRDEVATVLFAGEIDSVGSCSSCYPCATGTISVKLRITNDMTGYRTAGVLWRSPDNETWLNVGTVSIDRGDPANTTKEVEYFLFEGDYVKVIFGSEQTRGVMNTAIEVDDVLQSQHSFDTPGTSWETLSGTLETGKAYEFIGVVVSGWDDGITSNAAALRYNSTNYCLPYCGEGTSATCYIDADTLSESVFVYEDALGATQVADGYYSDGSRVVHIVGGMVNYDKDTSVCQCSQPVYKFKSNFDSVACDACAQAGTPTEVFGLYEILSENKFFYTDETVETPVADGYYSFAGISVATVSGDGLVTEWSDCVTLCSPTTEYGIYRLTNTGKNTAYYQYTGQDDKVYSGAIRAGDSVETVCCDITTLQYSSYLEVTTLANCA